MLSLCFEKCGLVGHTKAALDIFVEKFYSCYRDGLNGGKDLRSLASLYFFIRILIFVVIVVQSEVIFFICLALIFCGTSLVVAIVRPYKEAYMTNLDTLIFNCLVSGKHIIHSLSLSRAWICKTCVNCHGHCL